MKPSSINLSSFSGFLVPVSCFIAIIALVPLVILPQLTRITEANSTIKTKEARLARLDKKLRVLKNIDKDTLEEKLSSTEIALPSGKSLAPLIEGLKKISSESNMALTSIKLKPGKIATSSASKEDTSKTSETTLKLPTSRFDLLFTVDLKGNFSDFQKFLQLVEKTKRLLVVVNLSASSSPDGNNNFSLVMNAPFRDIGRKSSDIAAENIPADTPETDATYELLNTDFTEYTKPLQTENCQNCTGVENPFP